MMVGNFGGCHCGEEWTVRKFSTFKIDDVIKSFDFGVGDFFFF